MSYQVRIDAFQGPFDLLLQLVSRQRVDIGAISILEVTDQYLEHVAQIEELDLDVASDFLLVASTLLEMKAASLLPEEEVDLGEEFDDLSPNEAREILIQRLLAYKQFKNVSVELSARFEAEGRMHPRQAGLEPEFLNLMPDFLEGITLHGLTVICADLAMRRERFLLEAEHIAAMPIPLDLHMESVHRRVASKKRMRFLDLLGDDTRPEIVVVTLLAILELYKRGVIDLRQEVEFQDIDVVFIDEADRRGADAERESAAR